MILQLTAAVGRPTELNADRPVHGRSTWGCANPTEYPPFQILNGGIMGAPVAWDASSLWVNSVYIYIYISVSESSGNHPEKYEKGCKIY